MWACCGFPCVCMCVSCSDSQQDSLITEESKGCIFLIQKLDTWDSERYFKKEIQNDDAHLLGPYIKKGVWVEKKKWRRLDHYCLWGHEYKGMVLLFYVKKKKKERERGFQFLWKAVKFNHFKYQRCLPVNLRKSSYGYLLSKATSPQTTKGNSVLSS